MGNTRSTLSKTTRNLRKRGSLDNLVAMLSPKIVRCRMAKKSSNCSMNSNSNNSTSTNNPVNNGNLDKRLSVSTMDTQRSHSLASSSGLGSLEPPMASNGFLTANGLSSSRLSVPGGLEIALPSLEIPPTPLTRSQIDLVKATWGAVLSDSSNICLNFFLQLQRRYPHIKKLQQRAAMANSAPNIPSALFPIVSRNRSCSTDPQKQSQLPQLALRLACILDKFISKNAEVTEKDMIDLEDAGNEFKVFLGIKEFYGDSITVREIGHSFIEALRLILVHNKICEIDWDEDLQKAWLAVFNILLYHLDGIELDELWE